MPQLIPVPLELASFQQEYEYNPRDKGGGEEAEPDVVLEGPDEEVSGDQLVGRLADEGSAVGQHVEGEVHCAVPITLRITVLNVKSRIKPYLKF